MISYDGGLSSVTYISKTSGNLILDLEGNLAARDVGFNFILLKLRVRMAHIELKVKEDDCQQQNYTHHREYYS